MKKSRILAVAGVALLATGVLAACGSSKSSNAEAPKAYGYTYTADPETLDLYDQSGTFGCKKCSVC